MELSFTDSKIRTSQFVREKLLADPKIRSLVGDAIYPCVAPKTDGEYIVMTRVEYGDLSSKTGIYERNCNVLLEVFSDNYDKGVDIACAIDDLFSKSFELGEVGSYSTLKMVQSTESFNEGKYVQIMEYYIN